MDRNQARERAWALYRDLQRIGDSDAEQEVAGMALPVLDALVDACKEHVVYDPVVTAVNGLITPQAVEDGHLRAIDAALVVHQLALALGPETLPPSPPRVAGALGSFPPSQAWPAF